MKLRDVLEKLGYQRTPEEMLGLLSDDQLYNALLTTSLLMQRIRDEAVRRGRWEEWKTTKVKL